MPNKSAALAEIVDSIADLVKEHLGSVDAQHKGVDARASVTNEPDGTHVMVSIQVSLRWRGKDQQECHEQMLKELKRLA